jgi:hypothetical protein
VHGDVDVAVEQQTVGEVAAAALPYANSRDSSLSYFDCSRLRVHADRVSVHGPQSAKHRVRLKTICVREDAAAVEVGPVKIWEGLAESHDQVNHIVAVD